MFNCDFKTLLYIHASLMILGAYQIIELFMLIFRMFMFIIAYQLFIPLLFYQVLETAPADTELTSDETPPEFIQDEEL